MISVYSHCFWTQSTLLNEWGILNWWYFHCLAPWRQHRFYCHFDVKCSSHFSITNKLKLSKGLSENFGFYFDNFINNLQTRCLATFWQRFKTLTIRTTNKMCENQRIYGFSQSCRPVARPCHDIYNFTSFYVGRSLRTKLHFRLALYMAYTSKET